MPDMLPVDSRRMTHIGYDPALQEMHVTWKGGKVSVYEDVPQNVYDRVRSASSHGSALNDHVIPHFNHRYK